MTLDSWQEWEGRVVGGRFALGPYLGGSDHGVVYLTEFGGSRAVVKLVAADGADAEAQLARWEAARGLAHPNLLRIFDTGRWHADEEQDMFFAVMEYADENLGEILGERALSGAEAREMLAATLTALGHLHVQNLVHCDLKPSNVLAVGQELKLAVDGVRRSGSRVTGKEQEDWRAAPEVFNSGVSARNDIWALGLLLVESLTRQQVRRDRSTDDEVRLPRDMPEPFASIAKDCVQRNPEKRSSNMQIRQMLERPIEVSKPAAQIVAVRPEVKEREVADSEDNIFGQKRAKDPTVPSPASPPVSGHESADNSLSSTKTGRATPVVPALPAPQKTRTPEPRSQVAEAIDAGFTSFTEDHKNRFLPLAIALFVVVVAGASMIWFFSHGSNAPKPASVASQTPAPTASPVPAAQPAVSATPTPHTSPGGVAHQVMPEVSHAAQSTIHGVVKVRVQVNVNEAGQVTLAGLAARSPSHYFAKQALEAARQWNFTPPQVGGKAVASRWGIEFDFRRAGVKAESKVISPHV